MYSIRIQGQPFIDDAAQTWRVLVHAQVQRQTDVIWQNAVLYEKGAYGGPDYICQDPLYVIGQIVKWALSHS